jgi:SAM-dependent methyltransferase
MSNSMNEYWGREDLEGRILAALRESGKDLDALTIDDLAPFDHYHGGGKATTIRLAQLAGVTAGMRVLDVGGGLGGPARLLAAEYTSRVTVVGPDGVVHRCREGAYAAPGLDNWVEHRLGDGPDLRFDDSSFDLVWTQNRGMNIAAKEHPLRRLSPSAAAWWTFWRSRSRWPARCSP